jgi:CHAD domain-containing protein
VNIHGPELWLEELAAASNTARRKQDPQAVHRVRVAIERLRVWLILGKRRAPSDDLRWIRRRMAEVRDIDARLALDPPDALAMKLRAARAPAWRRARQALRSKRFASAIAALRSAPPLSRAAAVRGAARLARRAIERGDDVRRHRRDWSSLHAWRRAVRRTRYALDWLDEPSSTLGALQRSLGAVGDRVALIEGLGRGADERRCRRRMQRACQAYVDLALASWADVRRALKEVTTTPTRLRRPSGEAPKPF